MNFKSQICTTRKQSERLLALGLKKETADMGLIGDIPVMLPTTWANADPMFDTPAWSLHRLLELADISIVDSSVIHIYDNVIEYISYLIKCGYFNKEYLEEK